MNWQNLSENLIIVIVSALIGGFIGYTASTKANKQTVELLTPTIKEAIRKETTSITNEFKTEIKKLKNKDGSVALETEPVLTNQIEQTKQDTVTPKKKEGFFKRLFKKKNNN